MAEAGDPHNSVWQPSACILCECNCGIEVQLGGDGGRRLVKVRGDKAHPASQGYACEKPSRLDFYQNGTVGPMSKVTTASLAANAAVQTACGGVHMNHGFGYTYEADLLAWLGNGLHTVRAYALGQSEIHQARCQAPVDGAGHPKGRSSPRDLP